MPPPTHHRAIALIVTIVVAVGVARTSSRGQASANASTRRDNDPHDAGVAVPPRRNLRGPMDPNTADRAALESLPGVGPALAGRIIAARARGSIFRRPEDLRSVRGIGPRTVVRLTPWLRFANADAAVDASRADAAITGPSRSEARASP